MVSWRVILPSLNSSHVLEFITPISLFPLFSFFFFLGKLSNSRLLVQICTQNEGYAKDFCSHPASFPMLPIPMGSDSTIKALSKNGMDRPLTHPFLFWIGCEAIFSPFACLHSTHKRDCSFFFLSPPYNNRNRKQEAKFW